MAKFSALAAREAGGRLEAFSYDPGALGGDEVEIEVRSCGICHSDLSMRDNAWGLTSYPFVPGHEVAGVVARVGERVTTRRVGERVGLGWHARTCLHCAQCMGGDHNLCASQEGTIVGRHGGFADRVRCHHAFAVPIPDAIELADAGPMFCAGITVFSPLLRFGVRPTDRAAVIGIGGLGHLAVQFLRAWGCHVTAFTSTGSKAEEARRLGAHAVLDSRSEAEIAGAAGSFDFVLATVNVTLDWNAYVAALSPKGRLHVVGAVMEPLGLSSFGLIMGQKSVSGSPVGSPGAIATMLEFAARHGVRPTIEKFPMEQANEAFEHLEAGQARYRIVLER